MQIESISIKSIIPNPSNPRVIKDDKFTKLVQSIKDFPQMLEIRPIVVNDEMVVLGGNMRLRACQEAGLKEVFIVRASDLTPQQQKEFIIKDNVGYGEWDWDLLANQFGDENLFDWGIDLPKSWGEEAEIMDAKEVKSENLMAIVVVAYDDINDLDRITSLYELTSEDITENIKEQISTQRKMYVFKK